MSQYIDLHPTASETGATHADMLWEYWANQWWKFDVNLTPDQIITDSHTGELSTLTLSINLNL